ncbi:MAG: M12 family metallopeptidase [Capnocytophaga sp.]|nr:M12 family metallopeptidase [Capnocytophaga sp.]
MKKNFFLGIPLLFLAGCLSKEEISKDDNLPDIKVTCVFPNEHTSETLKSGVVVKKRSDNQYLFLGDILLSDKDLKLLDETGSLLTQEDINYDPKQQELTSTPISPQAGMLQYSMIQPRAVSYSSNIPRFWTMLRYKFAENITPSQKQAILDAIHYIEKETNARFYDATNEPDKHPLGFSYPNVVFTAANKNESYVGKKGGNQPLYLFNFTKGVICHEICHALGMFHEQSRSDRDEYINVLYENILPQYHDQFQKLPYNYYKSEKFDFNSVMLYGSDYFVNNIYKYSMTKKNGQPFEAQRNGLSEIDRKWINTFYLPYVGGKEICIKLDRKMYDRNNQLLSENEVRLLEMELNRGRCF